jgi:hypothetical protein
MSRLVNVQDSTYKLSVSAGGTITFNTGDQVGKVVITGNLEVLGNTVTVDTANLTIEDNIILLNKGESNAFVTERTAGIEIDRSSGNPLVNLNNAQILFDEDRVWLDTKTSTTKAGLFVFKKGNGDLIGIETNSITTNGYNLNLLGISPLGQTAVVHVNGADLYEERVLDYTAPGYPARNDDIIPNIKAVIDYVGEYFVVNPPFKIQDSKIVSGVTQLYDSKLEINDVESDGQPTALTLTLDGLVNAQWFPNRYEVQDIRISDSTITGLGVSADLVLTNPGTGSVKIDDNLKLALAPSAPALAADGIKLYAGTETEGGTGLFFVNTKSATEELTTRDELVSRRKALAFSMIF